MKWFVVFALMVFSFAFACSEGNDEPGGQPGDYCGTKDDCSGDLICWNFVCTEEDSIDGDGTTATGDEDVVVDGDGQEAANESGD